MIYVALLRGINVGGRNKVPMPELKAVFEDAGMADVRTYINSGNVIFSAEDTDQEALTDLLRDAIAKHFGFEVSVLVRDVEQIRVIVESVPAPWRNDDTMKCDVVFLYDEVDNAEVLGQFRIRPEIEDVLRFRGAIVWRIDREHATRSGLLGMVGTPLYRQVTVRNCNTVRKILELMQA